MATAPAPSPVRPFSLKDAPSLIEHIWPAQKISAEAQKERKAGAGQTLTALGSYWKGRKPLVLVRACVLGALLPATGDPERDLAIFEKLMAIDDDAFAHRVKKKVDYPAVLELPYLDRLGKCYRPEELPDSAYDGIWGEVNAHLGTSAHNFPELVEQLGIMRFGHRPKVADTFCGGGSIPFEAARLGCDVYASDLNPIACMLTWGALNIIGADEQTRKEIEQAQREVAEAVDREITELGIEHDEHGNRAKAYLYCLETRCPQTGWMVPMAPSWVISRTRRTVAKLVPDHGNRRFDILIQSGVSDEDMTEAEKGTVRDGSLIYRLDGETYSTPTKTIRGDYRKPDGTLATKVRLWEKGEFVPRQDDFYQERLYCIQWMSKETLTKTRPDCFFAAPTGFDLDRENRVEEIVRKLLPEWQRAGHVPDMAIEPGGPPRYQGQDLIRSRGWTFWHHVFNARELLMFATYSKHAVAKGLSDEPALAYTLCSAVDRNAKLVGWHPGSPGRPGMAPTAEKVEHVFYNQAFNTFYNPPTRSFRSLRSYLEGGFPAKPIAGAGQVVCAPATDRLVEYDISITDPPYSDAVCYHELYDFFIAWLRFRKPGPLRDWIWDSRRALAIFGEDEGFRRGMVQAYSVLADLQVDCGLHVVMFTHQSSEVWADMAQIFWGAGLQVMAAWYIATETTSDLKKGGFVQGTVILVLRNRKAGESGYRDEVVQEVRAEVARQITTMVGLNQTLKGSGRIENLFEDADLQMAGYAAALRVLTGYTRIDGTDMTQEALRPRKKGERGIVGEIIDFAVQVANEHMVPDPMDPRVWERLTSSERFYLKMMDIETTGAAKLDNYQNFSKAFRVPDYTVMMGSMKPNAAHLKSARAFKKDAFAAPEFGPSLTRAALYAVYELQSDVDSDEVLSHLRDLVPGYFSKRDDLLALAAYFAQKRQDNDPAEAEAARILYGRIHNERL